MPGVRVRHHCSCFDPLPKGKGHRTIKTGTRGGASCQLDQCSSYDHLRALRDAGEWEPMGIQAAPADEAMSGIQREASVIDNPLWMLVPWAVFVLAAGLKFWRITILFRKHLLGTISKTERFRQALERIWAKDRQR